MASLARIRTLRRQISQKSRGLAFAIGSGTSIASLLLWKGQRRNRLFTLLPSAKPRWKSSLIGWSVQTLSLVCLLLMGARVQDFISDEVVQTVGFGDANGIPSSEQRGVDRCSAPGEYVCSESIKGWDEQAIKAAEQIKVRTWLRKNASDSTLWTTSFLSLFLKER
jgi:hypothetical protein